MYSPLVCLLIQWIDMLKIIVYFYSIPICLCVSGVRQAMAVWRPYGEQASRPPGAADCRQQREACQHGRNTRPTAGKTADTFTRCQQESGTNFIMN